MQRHWDSRRSSVNPTNPPQNCAGEFWCHNPETGSAYRKRAMTALVASVGLEMLGWQFAIWHGRDSNVIAVMSPSSITAYTMEHPRFRTARSQIETTIRHEPKIITADKKVSTRSKEAEYNIHFLSFISLYRASTFYAQCIAFTSRGARIAQGDRTGWGHTGQHRGCRCTARRTCAQHAL